MHPEFPHQDIIHLNHAAVGPWPRRTADAVSAFAHENLVQGSQKYASWMKVQQQARELGRRLIGATAADDIAFVKNTSEALSMVAFGLDWPRHANVVIPKGEFPSNRIVWLMAAERFGLEVREVALDSHPSPEVALLAACDRNTALLSCSAVQFASGLRLDIERLGTDLRRRDILFCVDAIQHLGALPFDAHAVHADFVMADAHKWLLAPEGIALFYVRPEIRDHLRLQEFGWHMLADSGDFITYELTPAAGARRFEPGSPNLLGIHAVHASLSLLLDTGLERIAQQIDAHWQHLYEGLTVLGCRVLTPVDRHAGILTFFPAHGSAELLFQHLQEMGVLCAQRGGGIRFSPHFYLSPTALDEALARVADHC
ncbi:Cysteine desulfurase [Thioalkalivibrio nitratireducens DSM 14787]|uniref:Cysteine desulfurase n=1 Tax=Thioalkalivibrio nitratireducens (strain DSM 14787 / UNIQEM 213 / ALEN2) TaxID=1255043 RepID=L0DXZ5_THIND|nr:aminotransferase class V-fold PLP-dependent enzyme [Thioalkalivibrio nitratireducens]AGA33256.1 Cysteine desulfurase [Thioalkalivibrio nitratireducens DSM 14787]